MSASWTRKEDQKLLDYAKESLEKGQEKTELLEEMSQTLGRTPIDCLLRWEQLKKDQETANINHRLVQLEQRVGEQQKELNKLRKDLRFFELMLLEEYHLLIRLLGEDKQKIRLHRL